MAMDEAVEVVVDKAEEIFGEKEEDGSVFMSRDDWKPEDDSESTCSQPFGCCTVNVDIKRCFICKISSISVTISVSFVP